MTALPPPIDVESVLAALPDIIITGINEALARTPIGSLDQLASMQRGTVAAPGDDGISAMVNLDTADTGAPSSQIETLVPVAVGDRVLVLTNRVGTALVVGAAGSSPSGGPFVRLTGDTMTGPLILSGDATDPLGAVTKEQLDAVVVGVGVVLIAVTAIPRFQVRMDFPTVWANTASSAIEYLTQLQKNLPHIALVPIGGAPLRARLTAHLESTLGTDMQLAIYESTFDTTSSGEHYQLTPGGTLTSPDDIPSGHMYDTGWVNLTLLDAHTTQNSVVGVLAWTSDPQQAFCIDGTLKVALR